MACNVSPANCIPTDGSCEPAVTALLLKGSTTTSTGTWKNIFMSPTNVGNFGGITAVDSFCAANLPATFSGTYKGLVMGTARTQTTDWVLAASTEYRREDGTSIGRTNSSAIFTFPLTNPVSTSTTNVFTGITVTDETTWTFSGLANNCSDWGAGGNSLVGVSDNTASTMISNGIATCATGVPVYCVQQ